MIQGEPYNLSKFKRKDPG